MGRAATGRAAMAAALLLAAAVVGCRQLLPAEGEGGRGRRVTVRVLLPPPVNLLDRGVQSLAVLEFAGEEGPALARGLVGELSDQQLFTVTGPREAREQLLRLGLAVGWESTPSQLRWVHERAALDAVVVGRLEAFAISGRDKAGDALTAVETGEYGFVLNDEGKLAYREVVEMRRVPLLCRTDRGTVAASYRVWDTRRGELVATVRHELTTEVPAFCYRGDLPVEVERATQERLLRRLFADLNRQFLADILPRGVRREVEFAPLPGGAGSALVQGNELAILYATRDQWFRAAQVWEDQLRDHPELAPLHYNLALAYRAVCRLTGARDHLDQALTLAPRDPLVRRAVREWGGKR